VRLSGPKLVFDLDEFLPLDGESKVEIRYSNGVLNLDIFYERDGVTGDVRRTISFGQTWYFLKTPFPGYSFFDSPDDGDLSLLHSLVEYERSDWLARAPVISGDKRYKHYRLFLHSEGMAINVIAGSCELSVESAGA